MEFLGVYILEGSIFFGYIGVVNCDLEVFFDFNCFDLERDFKFLFWFLIFGGGVYLCIGWLLVM